MCTETMMRTLVGVLLISGLTSARAAEPCQIAWKAPNRDLSAKCLPAISADGDTIAVGSIETDGARGNSNLRIEFLPVQSDKTTSIVVVTPKETESTHGAITAPLFQKLIQPRLAKANDRLRADRFTSLANLAPSDPSQAQRFAVHHGDLEYAWSDRTLIVRKGNVVVATKQFPSVPTTAELEATPAGANCNPERNGPRIVGLFPVTHPKHGNLVLIESNFRGTDSCEVKLNTFSLIHLK